MIKTTEIPMEHNCSRFTFDVIIKFCGYELSCRFVDKQEAEKINDIAELLVKFDWIKAQKNLECITEKIWTLKKVY